MANYEDGEEQTACQQRWRSCCRFVYNPDNKQIFGRTGKSWALIGLFYLIFYSALAGFFTGMLAIFLNTVIKDDHPKLTGKQSLLKLTPGVSFFPLPNYKSTLIRFKRGDPLSYVKYKEDIEAKLKKIKDADLKPDTQYAKCNQTTDTKEPNDPMKVCRFSTDVLGDCDAGTDYGFKINKPCIFVKMNKIYGWIPDVKDNTYNPYIACQGETPADGENLGSLTYYPSTVITDNGGKNSSYAKISNIFFPYLNQKGYVAPVAAIQFNNLTTNVLIMVRCYLRGLVGTQLSVRLEIVMD